MSSEQAKAILDKLPPKQTIEPFTVTSMSPFTVNIGGGDVLARSLSGQSWSVGDTGMAIWSPPLPPFCFNTRDDTDWVNVTYDAGFSAGTPGQLQYRRVGEQVYLRGGATRSGSFPTDGTTYEVNSSNPLPTGYRPLVENWRFGTFGTAIRPAAGEVTTGGVIRLGVWDDLVVAPTWIACSTTYLAD